MRPETDKEICNTALENIMPDQPDKPFGRLSQCEMVAELRRQSVVGQSVPLGMPPPAARPEKGCTLSEYYDFKHTRGSVWKILAAPYDSTAQSGNDVEA